MRSTDLDNEERKRAHGALIRLANSCDRAAARGKIVAQIAPDLDEEDFRTIAEIRRDMAKTLE